MTKKTKIKNHAEAGKKLLLILLVTACCSFGACRDQGSEGASPDEMKPSSVSSADEQQMNSSDFTHNAKTEKHTDNSPAQNSKPAKQPEQVATSADLYCEEITVFSGVYVESGKNEKVENIAAILVENRSKVFLDRATITYKYGDKSAVFVATGLPAGEKCWVMEKSKLEVDGKHKFEFVNCVSAFNNNVIEKSEHITTMTKDNVVTVTNTSKQTLENVCVYYKNTFEDGSYLGGITYVLAFGKLEPGETIEKASAHFSEDSHIVKYSYQV